MLSPLLTVAQSAPPSSHNNKSTQKKAPTRGASPKGTSAKPASDTVGKDERIVHAIHDVSPQQVQQTIEKLVSFRTRHTLSVNNPGAANSPTGIVAARNWIRSEFERYSAACGGCLEVKTDTFIEQPKGPKDRVNKPTEIQNVYA